MQNLNIFKWHSGYAPSWMDIGLYRIAEQVDAQCDLGKDNQRYAVSELLVQGFVMPYLDTKPSSDASTGSSQQEQSGF